MSLEDDIHALVLEISGVSTVYRADPLWKTVVKHVGALLGPGEDAAPLPFVLCSEDDGDDSGSNGGSSGGSDGCASGGASSESNRDATGGGAESSGANVGETVGEAPVMTVRVRIGTDGSVPAPTVARSVAAEIRALVSVQRPELTVKAVVEISAVALHPDSH